MSSDIYKAFIFNKENKNFDILVFIGNFSLSKLDEITKDFKKNNTKGIFNKIFSKKDYNYFANDLSNIKFINDTIYESNTLEEISMKISIALGNLTFNELYMTGESEVDFNYDDLLYNLIDEGYVSKERLMYFLSNCIVDNKIKEKLDKNEKTLFNYEDLLDLEIIENISYIETPIGVKFDTERKFQYFHSPYEYQKDVFKFTSEYNNNEPLFSYYLATNNLWVYPFDDDYNEKKDVINIYYPLLKNKNLEENTIANIRNNLKQEQQVINDSFNKKEIINKIFHGDEMMKSPNISFLKIMLKPKKKMFISLETLFKILPTNKEKKIFIVKYNPGMKSDKLFKLATNNLKEPLLKRTFIQKINTEMSSSKRRYISIYSEFDYNKYNIPIIIEIYENGSTIVSINNYKILEDKRFVKIKNHYDLDDYSKKIKKHYNNFIDYLNEYFDHGNVSLPYFQIFNTENLEVLDQSLNFNYKSSSLSILNNIENISNNINNFMLVLSKNKNLMSLNLIPYFKIYNFKKIGIEIELDNKKKNYKIQVNKANHIGYIEYFQAFIYYLFKNAVSPSKILMAIKTGNVNIQNDYQEKDEEKEEEEEQKEDLFDKSDTRKGFDFSPEDNDSFLNSESSEQTKNSDTDELIKQSDSIQSDSIQSDSIQSDSIQSDRSENKKDTALKETDLISENESTQQSDEGVESQQNASSDSEGFLGGERNLLQKRIEERDSNLFENNKKVFKQPYSRHCPTSSQQQPVVLTPEEFEKIDKSAIEGKKGESEETRKKYFLKYGSDEKHMNYYFCPRYWCDDKNIPLKEEDVFYENKVVKSDKCKNSNGDYSEIIEFNHLIHANKNNDDYNWAVPTVSDKSSCIPCCKKNLNKNKPNSKCFNNNSNNKSDSNEKESRELTETNVKQKYNYIQQHNKFPLGEQKWGFLPLNIKAMFDYENIKCTDDFCLLRYGIEKDNNSFISALGSILYLENENNEVLLGKVKQYSVKKMRQEILPDSLNLDLFASLQNGNLIQIFGKSNKEKNNTSKYKKTIFYKKTKDVHDKLLYFAIDAYENFIDYIKNTEYLNYFYLYDLLSKPNNKLFKNGINLIIFEVDNLELTNKFRFICPTNFYEKNYFDKSKESVLLVKKKEGDIEYFEPIYSNDNWQNAKQKESKTNIIHRFNFGNKYLNDFFYKIESLQNNNLEYCGYRNLFKKEFFENGLKYLIEVLKNYNFIIRNQILYYNGKICGLECEHNKNHFYLPCILSGIDENISIRHINYHIFKDYKQTKNDLMYIYNVCDNKIPCNPIKQMIDNEKENVVALVTQDELIVPLIKKEKITDQLEVTLNNMFIIEDDKAKYVDEIIFDKEINEKESQLDTLEKRSKSYNKFKQRIKKILDLPKYKYYYFKFVKTLNDYELEELEKRNKIKEILVLLLKDKNYDYEDEILLRLINDIITNYRINYYISLDDQYLFVNNFNKNKDEIILTQDILFDKNLTINRDIFNKDDLYKHITLKDNAHDYADPILNKEFDINIYFEKIKKNKLFSASPKKDSLKDKQEKSVKIKRRKGFKFDNKLGQIIEK